MKNILSIIVIAAFMTGCGPAKISSGVNPAAGDGPTLVANQPKDDKAPVKKKKPKKSVSAPKPQEPVAQVPAELPVAKPQPAVAVPQAPAPVIVPPKPGGPAVVAMGSTGKKASDFMDQGYNAAILNARFCLVTGQFPGGSQCYLVYSDGRTEWASYNNRPAAQAFIVQLTQAKDAQQKAKEEKKAAKKRKNNE